MFFRMKIWWFSVLGMTTHQSLFPSKEEKKIKGNSRSLFHNNNLIIMVEI